MKKHLEAILLITFAILIGVVLIGLEYVKHEYRELEQQNQILLDENWNLKQYLMELEAGNE